MEVILDVLRGAADGDARSIWLIAAIYVLVVCGYSVVYQYRMRRWPGTQGRLHDVGVEAVGGSSRATSERDYVASARYEYAVDGVTYEGTRVSPWIVVASHNLKSILRVQTSGLAVGPGGEVTVHYNPRNPKKCILVRPGYAGMIATLLMAFAPLVLYVEKFVR